MRKGENGVASSLPMAFYLKVSVYIAAVKTSVNQPNTLTDCELKRTMGKNPNCVPSPNNIVFQYCVGEGKK